MSCAFVNDVLPEYRGCEQPPVLKVLSINDTTYGSLFNMVLDNFTYRRVLVEWNRALAFGFITKIDQPFGSILHASESTETREIVKKRGSFVRVMRVEVRILSIVDTISLRRLGYPTQNNTAPIFGASPGERLILQESGRYVSRDSRFMSIFSPLFSVGNGTIKNLSSEKKVYLYGDGLQLRDLLSQYQQINRVQADPEEKSPTDKQLHPQQQQQQKAFRRKTSLPTSISITTTTKVSKQLQLDFTRPKRFQRIKPITSNSAPSSPLSSSRRFQPGNSTPHSSPSPPKRFQRGNSAPPFPIRKLVDIVDIVLKTSL